MLRSILVLGMMLNLRALMCRGEALGESFRWQSLTVARRTEKRRATALVAQRHGLELNSAAIPGHVECREQVHVHSIKARRRSRRCAGRSRS